MCTNIYKDKVRLFSEGSRDKERKLGLNSSEHQEALFTVRMAEQRHRGCAVSLCRCHPQKPAGYSPGQPA